MKKSRPPEKTNKPEPRSDANKKAERVARKKAAAEAKAKAKLAESVRKKERDARREKERAARAELYNARAKKRKAVYAKIFGKLKNVKHGFDYENHGILPRAEFEVKGDRASIAARLSSAQIKCDNLREAGGFTLFEIPKKESGKVIAILQEMCYNYRISATYGIGRFCSFAAARCGLLLGVLFSAFALHIAYGYVWRVEVIGNDKLSDSVILSALGENGVSRGCKKQGVDELVVASLRELDGVVDCACETVGTTLKVRVLESTDFTVHTTAPAYASRYDATVTRVVMRSGSSLVKRGDVVSKGELLARGEVYGTTGELLYTGACDADIYGTVSLTFSADISTCGVEYVRTGRHKRRTVFDLFGLSLGKTASPFDSYETSSRTANYDVLLPLYITTYDYYETAPVEVERNVDEVARSFALSKIDELGFVGDFDYKYTVSERFAGLYTVHMFLSGETLISVAADPPPPVDTNGDENKSGIIPRGSPRTRALRAPLRPKGRGITPNLSSSQICPTKQPQVIASKQICSSNKNLK